MVIGVGLIGGSFALALRKAEHRQGISQALAAAGKTWQRARRPGRDRRNCRATFHRRLKDADLVFLAYPVGQTGEIMAQISPYLEPDTIVTDAGSTKQNVVAAARAQLTEHLRNFVPDIPSQGRN